MLCGKESRNEEEVSEREKPAVIDTSPLELRLILYAQDSYVHRCYVYRLITIAKCGASAAIGFLNGTWRCVIIWRNVPAFASDNDRRRRFVHIAQLEVSNILCSVAGLLTRSNFF